jgi:hypothetical protein
MSQTARERESLQKVPAYPKQEPARLESHSETTARLREQAEDGKLRRWREKTFIRSFLLVTFLLCTVWTVVFLSGGFSPADKEQMTNLLGKIIYGLACFLAGKNIKLNG